ncbi:response regulator [Roseomonas sp. E05]|uniref:response regulator n=1 Tax=Roseomonas sp. E05 TaxID=3046310 RepID=UPI0024BAF6FA|nr:response regulator [Roseomonas sp. E05]MDJ0390110.1 response regulator [Roseomonas sp. E05]
MARILVVDDEAIIALALSMLLEDHGHEVEVASNGRAALAAASNAPPDLLITDYMMPLMNGAELIAAIRSSDELRHVPIILSSAADEAQIRAATMAYDGFVAKPASKARILQEVERLLGR